MCLTVSCGIDVVVLFQKKHKVDDKSKVFENADQTMLEFRNGWANRTLAHEPYKTDIVGRESLMQTVEADLILLAMSSAFASVKLCSTQRDLELPKKLAISQGCRHVSGDLWVCQIAI